MHAVRTSSMPVIRACALALAVLAAACRGGTDASPVADLMPGTYSLAAVDGQGPASGSFVLGPNGAADRRVRYGDSDAEHVALGVYEIRAGAVHFSLREDSGRSAHVWRVRGQIAADRFSIQYPAPADGPDIVETYVRQ